jgi:hypothetical protein
MTNNQSADDYKSKTKGRDRTDPWEKIVNHAGDNKTILKKEIYKDPYDCSDNNAKSKAFINKRKEFLTQLPTIDQDNNFHNPYKGTTESEQVKKFEAIPSSNQNSSRKFNKEEWFKEKKDVMVRPTKELGGMNCLQKSLSASNNRKNNLYNMKHLVSA